MNEGRRDKGGETSRTEAEGLGLGLFLQRHDPDAIGRIPTTRDISGAQLYPEVDADGDHVHFEMLPMGGDSLLGLTIRRETSPELAASSLRKIADLIERHGNKVLNLLEGHVGSFNAQGGVVPGPLRLSYDENGDLVVPE